MTEPTDLFGEPALAPDGPLGLGRAMTGGSGKVARRGNDYYPTPAEVIRAFLRVEGGRLATIAPGPVWEPCGRGGAIIRELQAIGLSTVASDIVPDLEHEVEKLDVLAAPQPLGRKVMTNPPFAIAAAIIFHLLERLEVDYLALLLKAQYWHAAERIELFRKHPPARIYALTWRADFTGAGAPTMDCSWVVWERGNTAATVFDLLERNAPQARLL